MKTLDATFRDSASRNPTSVCLIGQNQSYTYQETSLAVGRVASGLVARGLSVGDRVLYSLPNGPAISILYFAILHAGGVAVPVNFLLSPNEKDAIRRLTQPRICIDQHGEFRDFTIPDSESIEGLPMGNEIDPVTHDGADTATILFTSGTSGYPKGILLSHANLVSNARWVIENSLSGPVWGPEDRSIAALPLSHSFGLTCVQNTTLLSGGGLAFQPAFVPELLLKQIRQHDISKIALVPSGARSLLEAWTSEPGQVPLCHCLIGGAPIDPELVDAIESQLKTSVLEGYGLTETSPVAAFRTPNTPRVKGSVGRAAGFAELAVLQKDKEILERGEGELLVRGPGVFQGYLDDDEATSAAFVGEWLRTGDLAKITESDDLYVLDRIKDLIVRNGYNVSPVEVEAALVRCVGVADAAVVGLPDPQVGEEIVAFVVSCDSNLTEDHLIEDIKVHLARFKVPRSIRFVDRIPRGTKGQVLRDRLLAES